VKEQQAWVSGFLNKPVNNFQDYMNRDKELNDLFKTEDVQSNKGLISQYAKLKQALDQHADELGSALPDDLKAQYGQAKSLWKQAAQYETLPGNTDASEWYKQFQKETDPRAIATGEKDENGFLKGNPGNFLQNTFSKSGALADQSAKVKHLTSLLGDEDKANVASAYLNPDALKKVKRSDLATRLNHLNPDSKQVLFGSNTPAANALQRIASNPIHNALARHASAILGMVEGAKFGHPWIGYGVGSAIPSLFERRFVKAPTGVAEATNSLKGLKRPYAILPAAMSALSPDQNQKQ
jgi:hypothetical protein